MNRDYSMMIPKLLGFSVFQTKDLIQMSDLRNLMLWMLELLKDGKKTNKKQTKKISYKNISIVSLVISKK